MNDPTSSKTHPLILAAAVAVILFAGVGAAHWLGWVGQPIPTPHAAASIPAAITPQAALTPIAEPAATPTPTLAPTPAPTAVPTATPTPRPKAKPTPRPTHVPHPDPTPVKQSCANCGEVTAIRSVEVAGDASGGGAVAGGVVGGVLGNQIGKGNGRKVATVLGALGGAVAGHQIEKQVRKTTVYEVDVAFEDGSSRSYQYPQQPTLAQGQAVKDVGGELVAR
ncbi:MAG TPA: glycine zipper 2TM domain-containing protein [Chitinolyticbacter sp.]|nr:glycine zipper 2TM domain-containing protein [Chitinolyticbacter sp.]